MSGIKFDFNFQSYLNSLDIFMNLYGKELITLRYLFLQITYAIHKIEKQVNKFRRKITGKQPWEHLQHTTVMTRHSGVRKYWNKPRKIYLALNCIVTLNRHPCLLMGLQPMTNCLWTGNMVSSPWLQLIMITLSLHDRKHNKLLWTDINIIV